MRTWTKYFILHISSLSWIPLVVFGVLYYLFAHPIVIVVPAFLLIPIWLICMKKMDEEEDKVTARERELHLFQKEEKKQ